MSEMISGFDLIEEQIKVAQGHKLSFGQDDIKLRGHSIECRINAEDAFKNFRFVLRFCLFFSRQNFAFLRLVFFGFLWKSYLLDSFRFRIPTQSYFN